MGLGMLACARPVAQLTPAAKLTEVGRSDPSYNYKLIGGFRHKTETTANSMAAGALTRARSRLFA